MSGGMSDKLAEVFGTDKTASASGHTTEDLEKRAQFEFFGALCKEQGINVNELNDQQVEDLYKAAMEMRAAGKTAASEDKSDEEKKKEEEAKKEAASKTAAAEREWQEKRAAAVKVAEAEAMGRIMAHAYVDELGKIAEAMNGKPGGGFPFPPKKEGDDKDDDKKKDEKKEEGKDKEGSAASKAAALIAAFEQEKRAAAGGAASGTSTTPSFDEQAAYRAIDLLKAAGVDAELAFKKVDAAYTLGLKDSTKIASAGDFNTALQVRAYEICEAAGFAVNWSQAAA